MSEMWDKQDLEHASWKEGEDSEQSDALAQTDTLEDQARRADERTSAKFPPGMPQSDMAPNGEGQVPKHFENGD